MTAPWITYRPALKVLDCTIRDGGLINDHAFEDGFVKAVYDACVAAGIDYMEIGYKASKKLFARDQVRRLEVLRRGRPAADRRRQSHAAEAGGDGRRRQVRLAHRHPAQEGQRAGHDPRGLLRPPGLRGGRHDQGRRRQGLRGVGQPDGRLHRHRTRSRPGAGGDRRRRRPACWWWSTATARCTPSRSSCW